MTSAPIPLAVCMQLVSQGEQPTVCARAKVYLLEGDLSAEDVEAVKRYVINPVESARGVA